MVKLNIAAAKTSHPTVLEISRVNDPVARVTTPATASAPIAMWAFGRIDLVPVALALALIVLWRHRANIGRLMKGEEPKIGTSKGAATE